MSKRKITPDRERDLPSLSHGRTDHKDEKPHSEKKQKLETHKDNNNQQNPVCYYGTTSIAAVKLPVEICNTVRSVLFEVTGIAWPFKYDDENGTFTLKNTETIDSMSMKSIPRIYLSIGKCAKNISEKYQKLGFEVPKIISRLNNKTSQGRIFMSSVKTKDTEIIAVVKTDVISAKTKSLWIGNKKEKHKHGNMGTHLVISSAYIDALCSIILSNLVENNVSPHFPVCYATGISGVKLKREDVKPPNPNCNTLRPRDHDSYNNVSKENSGNSDGKVTENTDKTTTPHQVIWMEYLPFSMFQILEKEPNHEMWWSCFFQVFSGLSVAFDMFSFIHNDLHSENVRVRKVPKSSIIYYKTLDGTILRVPTFGYVYVLIDFGRAFIKPCGPEKFGVLSSEFSEGGSCSKYIPDNPSIDVFRLLASVDDKLPSISDETKRSELKTFFNKACATTTGYDILSQLYNCRGDAFTYHLDSLPREICRSQPNNVLSSMCDRYKIDSSQKPRDIVPFELPINLVAK